MRHIILGLGAALIAAGLAALFASLDLIGIERGTAYLSAGAALISGGVVTLALSAVVGRLDRLLAAQPAPKRAAADFAAAAPALGAMAAAVESAPRPVEGLTNAEPVAKAPAPLAVPQPAHVAAPALDEIPAREPYAEAAAEIRMSDAEPADEIVAAPAPIEAQPPHEPRSSWSAPPRIFPNDPPLKLDLAAADPPKPEPARAQTEPSVDEPVSTDGPRLATGEETAREDDIDWLSNSLSTGAPASAAKPPPRIVGRYQAGGVDYVMYSDGSIEADNGGVRQRFATLAELKAFIGET